MSKKASIIGQDEIILKRARHLDYQRRILEWKNKDPLKCKKCSRTMELVQVWIKGKGTVFNLYEKLATGPPVIKFLRKEENECPNLDVSIIEQQILAF